VCGYHGTRWRSQTERTLTRVIRRIHTRKQIQALRSNAEARKSPPPRCHRDIFVPSKIYQSRQISTPPKPSLRAVAHQMMKKKKKCPPVQKLKRVNLGYQAVLPEVLARGRASKFIGIRRLRIPPEERIAFGGGSTYTSSKGGSPGVNLPERIRPPCHLMCAW